MTSAYPGRGPSRQDPGDHDLDLLIGDLVRRARPGRVRQAVQPPLGEPDAPLADHLPRDPTREATAVIGMVPDASAQASTIRARKASECDAVRLRTSDSRSASVSTSGTTWSSRAARRSEPADATP